MEQSAKELILNITYTEQEAKDAQAAVLDCMKGKLHIRRWEYIFMGVLGVGLGLIFVAECIIALAFGVFTFADESLFKAILYGPFCLLGGIMSFNNAKTLRKNREQGITDEVIIESWYNACREIGEVLLVFGKKKMILMPNVEDMGSTKAYWQSFGAREYSSGIVVSPAAWQHHTYFIPRRVLDEYNGEIESFLEKKFKKRYKVMGR